MRPAALAPVMKIVKNAAGAVGLTGSKSGVGSDVSPFKKVMNGGGKEPSGKLSGAPLRAASLPHGAPDEKSALRPPPLPGGVTPKRALATRSAVLTPPPVLKAVRSAEAARDTARATAHAKADNLVELRKESVAQNTQRYDTRLVDLICQELKIGFTGDELGARRREAMAAANSDRLPPVPQQQQQQQVATVTPISQTTELAQAKHEAEVKAASAVELIEKIEVFVKSQRPGLAITLDGSLGARVEIERLGPKEVAIRVVGKNGPPAPEDIGRIREEMRARGLKVGALSVA